MKELRSTDQFRRVLEQCRVIAVLGAHPDRGRAAHYVPAYLHQQGYRILPVNPLFEGQTLWGARVCATLAEIGEPVDMVDVFRRPEAIPSHLDDILAMRPHPSVVWFQLGIRNDHAAAKLLGAGIEVVQDRCTLADHRALGVGRAT